MKSFERDGFFGFNADCSIRDGMIWDDLCNIELIVPDIQTQQKYVAVYESMLKNLKCYEKGLDDLKFVCDGYIEEVKCHEKCF